MNNNKLIAGIFFLASALMACSKDEGQTPDPAPVPIPAGNITVPPASFTKKVLLEYHTASWCGTCVDAEVKRDLVLSTYSGRVIPVAIHQSDGMQIPLFMTIDATFGSSPAFGMVNRLPSLNTVLLNRTQWLTNTSNCISSTAKCGLAIKSAITGSVASIEVQSSFRQNLTGTYNLTVYLVENNVTGTGSGYDQVNSYNTDVSSPYFNLGNPIIGYKHQYVVKKVLTANLGDAIDASKLVTDGLLKKTFSADITGMNTSNLFIVAFINKTGTNSTTHEVINVQQAKLGTLKNWD